MRRISHRDQNHVFLCVDHRRIADRPQDRRETHRRVASTNADRTQFWWTNKGPPWVFPRGRRSITYDDRRHLGLVSVRTSATLCRRGRCHVRTDSPGMIPSVLVLTARFLPSSVNPRIRTCGLVIPRSDLRPRPGDHFVLGQLASKTGNSRAPPMRSLIVDHAARYALRYGLSLIIRCSCPLMTRRRNHAVIS